jgi:hypothetical protein
MNQNHDISTRLFTEVDAERVDELGFLDCERTPRLVRIETILREPLAWILGPPWLGKSWVAGDIHRFLRFNPDSFGVAGRYCLTQLGAQNAAESVPPQWWSEWIASPPCRAIWLIDGVDEGLEANRDVLDDIYHIIRAAPTDHLKELRLVLFSRPYDDVGEFRDQLNGFYPAICNRYEPQHYWLARLDQAAAETLVGPEKFPGVLAVIEKNNLESVSGYPVVLTYLARHPEAARLSISQVWQGILTALLGERYTNALAKRFETEQNERFDAACRIAAVLTLMRQDTIRNDSLDTAVPAFGTLWQKPDNRKHTAAREACQTNGFMRLPEQGAFRFGRRNVQDWLATFAIERLPIPAMRSALLDSDGTLAARLREPARLIKLITDRADVRAEIDRISGGVLLPSGVSGITCVEAVRCLDQLEALAGKAPWGLQLYENSKEDLSRLRADGLGTALNERLRDAARLPQAKQLLIHVAEATKTAEAADASVDLVLDRTQPFGVRLDAMLFVTRFGGDAHLRQLEAPIGEHSDDSEDESRLRAVLINWLLGRGIWPLWKAALRAPRKVLHVIDQRGTLLGIVEKGLTVTDARQLLPHLTILYERHLHSDYSSGIPAIVERTLDLIAGQTPADSHDIQYVIQFAFALPLSGEAFANARNVAMRFQSHAGVRRAFYERDMDLREISADDKGLSAYHFLLSEDLPWLRDQAMAQWSGIPDVWEDVYWLARRGHQLHEIADPEWNGYRALVEDKAPGLPARFEERALAQQRQQEQFEAAQRERKKNHPAHTPLRERIHAILKAEHVGAAKQMRELGVWCFSQAIGLDQVKPSWEELPDDLRSQVLEMCKTGLECGQPTPIPPDYSIP